MFQPALHFFVLGAPKKCISVLSFFISIVFFAYPVLAQIHQLGPVGSPAYDSQGKNGNGTGQVHCIAFHPNYNMAGDSDSKTVFLGYSLRRALEIN